MVYYNEFDPKAAAWLRELIAQGHIAAGDVDERSIADVRADDLARYSQCHFFAGIGGWSLAARLAGLPDDYPIWTGSCPCQPFSAAGKGAGASDARHLWPEFYRLIAESRPVRVCGEQVASALGRAWVDAVSLDLEELGYAVWPTDLCAAGVGAPHIRQRLYWVAQSTGAGRHAGDGRSLSPKAGKDAGSSPDEGRHGDSAANRGAACRLADAQCGSAEHRGLDVGGAARIIEGRAQERQRIRDDAGAGFDTCGLADAKGSGYGEYERDAGAVVGTRGGHEGEEPESGRTAQAIGDCCEARGLADAEHAERGTEYEILAESYGRDGSGRSGYTRGLADALPAGRPEGWAESRSGSVTRSGESGRVGDTDLQGSQGWIERGDGAGECAPGAPSLAGFWSDAIYLPCRDGKARPTQPGLFPLAHGVSGRVGLLRGYGNAIVPEVAAAFLEAALNLEGV